MTDTLDFAATLREETERKIRAGSELRDAAGAVSATVTDYRAKFAAAIEAGWEENELQRFGLTAEAVPVPGPGKRGRGAAGKRGRPGARSAPTSRRSGPPDPSGATGHSDVPVATSSASSDTERE
ncbi:hypothetical protein ACTD5D_40430 [Nocardia takedensis]|uniref:hypothetical protein n=1 Tax=Nocardia takedensis TaxID=259390 RepID=UPI003F75C7EE